MQCCGWSRDGVAIEGTEQMARNPAAVGAVACAAPAIGKVVLCGSKITIESAFCAAHRALYCDTPGEWVSLTDKEIS